MSKMYLVLILLLIVVVQAEAFTNLESNYGTPLSGLDARSAAMGHTGIAASRGTYALIYNPAALTLVNNASEDLAIDLTYINISNENSTSFSFTGAEEDATYYYSIDDVTGTGPLTGNAVVSAADSSRYIVE